MLLTARYQQYEEIVIACRQYIYSNCLIVAQIACKHHSYIESYGGKSKKPLSTLFSILLSTEQLIGCMQHQTEYTLYFSKVVLPGEKVIR